MKTKSVIVYTTLISFIFILSCDSAYANKNKVSLSSMVEQLSQKTNENYAFAQDFSNIEFFLNSDLKNITKSQLKHFLAQKGLAISEIEGINHITSLAQMKSLTPKLVQGNPTNLDDYDLVSAVIPLKHVQAFSLVPVLRQLIPMKGHLGMAGKSLIAVSYYSNIKNLTQIIEAVDTKENAAYYKTRWDSKSKSMLLKVRLKEAEARLAQANVLLDNTKWKKNSRVNSKSGKK